MATERLPDDFVRSLTEVQDRLYAYILTLLPDRTAALEVLQEANVVMCRKFEALKPGQPFEAWACQIALYEVRTYRRDQSRDRHIFNDELLTLVAEDAEQHHADKSTITAILEYCLGKLDPARRDLIRARYRQGGSVASISQETGRSSSSISVSLYRIRKDLLECIERRLDQEDRS